MTNLRTLLFTALAIGAIVAACAGSPTQPSPTPPPSSSPGPTTDGLVDTPEEAFAAVVAHDARFAAIGPYRADLIGQSAWYKVTPASGVGAFVVEIQVGWGDCQAGCIDRHTWTFAVLPDGTVNLLSETGGPVPPAVLPPPIGAGQTGIGGIASAGPTCPVERPGDPACAPRAVAGAVVVVHDAGGAEVARGTTAADGTFFIPVGAGAYTAIGEPVDGLMGTPAPITVTVVDGAPSVVLLAYDTGIR